LRQGTAVGGASVGLAVLGLHVYSAEAGSVTSRQALRDPFDRRVTLARSPFVVPLLATILTDSHFGERNRECRLVAFLARLNRDGAAVPASASTRGRRRW
jgi:cyanophycinase-like exopeptidase